jgi:hypothetical protein
MQAFFFDMKDGVPMRDRVGIDFKNDLEAIEHCKELAKHFRDGSLLDDQDLEVSVVNSGGREIHREFVLAIEGRSVGVGRALHRRFQCIKMENK